MPNISPEEFMSILPLFAQAIKRQENDPTGMMGVRSMTGDPGKILNQSILNNFNRWQGGKAPAPWIKEKPKKFIDFMQRRWAPLGAENDPKNLNQYWAPGVRSILKQMVGEDEYRRLEGMDLVRGDSGTRMI